MGKYKKQVDRKVYYTEGVTMTITIEPPSDIEDTITQAASHAGMTLEQYTLCTLVDQAKSDASAYQKKKLTNEEWARRLAAIGERHAPLPQPIPLEALRRENIYEE